SACASARRGVLRPPGLRTARRCLPRSGTAASRDGAVALSTMRFMRRATHHDARYGRFLSIVSGATDTNTGGVRSMPMSHVRALSLASCLVHAGCCEQSRENAEAFLRDPENQRCE